MEIKDFLFNKSFHVYTKVICRNMFFSTGDS